LWAVVAAVAPVSAVETVSAVDATPTAHAESVEAVVAVADLEPVVAAAPSIDEDVLNVVEAMADTVVEAETPYFLGGRRGSDEDGISRNVDASEEYDASDEMSVASSLSASSLSASSLASSMSQFRLLMAADPGVSIDEVFVEDLISECTGDLEDLDDALSEVFDELHGPGESPSSSSRQSSSRSPQR
jgi:hypothetical protein